MKIKIFRCEDMETCLNIIEHDVNEFIKDKKVIDIKYQEHTSYNNYLSERAGDIDGSVFGSILVEYEDI